MPLITLNVSASVSEMISLPKKTFSFFITYSLVLLPKILILLPLEFFEILEKLIFCFGSI